MLNKHSYKLSIHSPYSDLESVPVFLLTQSHPVFLPPLTGLSSSGSFCKSASSIDCTNECLKPYSKFSAAFGLSRIWLSSSGPTNISVVGSDKAPQFIL